MAEQEFKLEPSSNDTVLSDQEQIDLAGVVLLLLYELVTMIERSGYDDDLLDTICNDAHDLSDLIYAGGRATREQERQVMQRNNQVVRRLTGDQYRRFLMT